MLREKSRTALNLLSKRIKQKMEEVLGIRELTLIQEVAIPVILKGYNALVMSPAGTGKTEAVMLPILDRLSQRKGSGIRALYITPLRALNRDVFRRISSLAKELELKVEIRHGDTSDYVRRRQAIKPPDIMITTPETLQAILVGKVIREHLRNVEFVVVDEIHEIIGEKRGVQLLLGLERLRNLAFADFQRIGLSATIGDPKLVAGYLQGSSKRIMKILDVRFAKKYEIIVDYPQRPDMTYKIPSGLELPEEVIARMEEILKELKHWRAMLIFTNTREAAELLASRLKIFSSNLKVSVHHGSLSKEERIDAEERLKEGKLKAIICTSSLELGIDIGYIDFVLQYASPRRATNLLQRIGRAGHRVRGTARGKIIALSVDEILEAAVLAKMALRGELESIKVHDLALDVLAHQLAGMVLEKGALKIEDALTIIKRARAYNSLEIEDFLRVIEQLEKEGKIRVRNGTLYKTRDTWRYYFENISTIPDVISYKVIDIVTGKEVGELDEEFIAIHGEEGKDFILAGRVWRIVEINHEDRKVIVEPSSNLEAAIPAWMGELIPVPFRCAVEVGSLRRRIAESLMRGKDPRKILARYPLTNRACEALIRFFNGVIRKNFRVPSDKIILIEGIKGLVVVHTPLGSNGNYALGVIISHALSRKLLASVAFRSDPYRIVLRGSIKLSPVEVRSLLQELATLSDNELKILLNEALSNTEAFKWHLYHIAKRFGLISRKASYGLIMSRRFLETLVNTPIYTEALRETQIRKIDLDAVKWLFNRLRKGIMKLEVTTSSSPSPFAEPIITRYFYDIIPSTKPIRLVLEAVKGRLMNSEVRLICLHCTRWSSIRTIQYLPDEIRCPLCNSKFLAVLDPKDHITLGIIKRAKLGLKLNRDEKEKLRRAQESAMLVLNYGKRALLALAARGIGPKTAIKILRETYDRDEYDFYMKILEAEKQYVRTRRFWN